MLNKPHITDTESKIWTKCLDSDERGYIAEFFFSNPWFIFHLLSENYADGRKLPEFRCGSIPEFFGILY
jgi:hypothetical protein